MNAAIKAENRSPKSGEKCEQTRLPPENRKMLTAGLALSKTRRRHHTSLAVLSRGHQLELTKFHCSITGGEEMPTMQPTERSEESNYCRNFKNGNGVSLKD